MEFYNESLKTLAEQAVIYLNEKGKSGSTISKYVWIWQQIDRFLHDHQLPECNQSAILEYVRQRFGDKKISDLTHYQKSCVSQAFNLIQFKESGSMFEMIEHVPKEKAEFKGEIGSLMLDFIQEKRSRRLCEKTLGNYRWYLYGLQNHLHGNGITQVRDISPLAVLSYCTQLPPGHLGAKHAALCLIRTFLRYAYDQNKASTDLSLSVPSDNYKRQHKLPSMYSKDEANRILSSVDRCTATGKRNYAILMLLIRLGLRASDVRELSFYNILWTMNLVSFHQYKTGKKIELPLPADVGEAIIDYLKYGRPDTPDNHLFVEHISPFSKLSEKGVPRIANHAICHSGVDVGRRKHGSHALRHTMAGFLLEGQTPVTIISEMLGHSSVQTTMCYLRVDVESLRGCALDVPAVDRDFYLQKGGAFYE